MSHTNKTTKSTAKKPTKKAVRKVGVAKSISVTISIDDIVRVAGVSDAMSFLQAVIQSGHVSEECVKITLVRDGTTRDGILRPIAKDGGAG